MVKINFLGSCREVGRSAILIESKSGEKGLLDFGVRFDAEERLPLETDLRGLKFAALTHCHVDHSGALPALKKCSLSRKPSQTEDRERLLHHIL
ncbi:MAG: MBL fold metallo-hydrolase [Candidatus Lokiarchaeota archaeon]